MNKRDLGVKNNLRIFLMPFLRRLRLFIFIILDIAFIFLCFEINKESFHASSKFFLTFTALWILLSYFFGRYYISNRKKIKSLARLFFLSLLIIPVTFFIYQFLFSFTDQFYVSEIFSINNYIYLFIFSITSNIYILFFNSKTYKKLGSWIIINDKNYIFKDSNIFFDKKHTANFIYEDDLDKFESYKKFIDGIIVFNLPALDNISLNKLFKLKKEGFLITDPQAWCRDNLLRYPPEIFLTLNTYESISKLEFSIYSRVKRLFDISLSIILLLITFPVILFACFFIYLEDKGPVFYSQVRTGYSGKIFRIYKIRSMRQNSEPDGPVWTQINDSRTLKFGRFIRNTRIDELPQLISVLSGDMSLIGPRPERPEIEKNLIQIIPNYMQRYQMKPGLSGWAQINYPYGASNEDSKNKLSYDLFYILEHSIWLDFIIFIRTIRVLLKGSGSKPKSNEKYSS